MIENPPESRFPRLPHDANVSAIPHRIGQRQEIPPKERLQPRYRISIKRLLNSTPQSEKSPCWLNINDNLIHVIVFQALLCMK
jgi:hypothetical protein